MVNGLLMFALQSLISMIELRETANFPYKVDVDRAVGVAVRVLGPQVVIDAVPLLISGEE